MSKTLSSVAKAEFDDEVKHAYQTKGANLTNTVTVRNNVKADTYNFRKMGKGLANQKPSQANVTPMNVPHSKQVATLENWNAPEYTDIFDAAEVNFDEQKELAETISGALGRREDQLIIDAMNAASSPAGTVGTDIGGTSSDLNVDKLRRASRYLNAKGVPSTDRHLLHSAIGLEAMLGETEATSSDYASVKALVNGEMDTFVGFKFHNIEDRDEGGLPLASTRTSFAYHKAAVGIAMGLGPRTEVNYIAEKTSWLANGILKAGAITRDGDGLVKLTTTEA